MSREYPRDYTDYHEAQKRKAERPPKHAKPKGDNGGSDGKHSRPKK